MNIVKEFLDKWSMMLDDEKAIADFKDEVLSMMIAVQIDTEVSKDVDELIDWDRPDEPEGEV